MARLVDQALMPVGNTHEEFTKFFDGEIAKWATVLKPLGSLPE
jgi:tripartite-type tricarboxylate transporter receptor subunit TctC